MDQRMMDNNTMKAKRLLEQLLLENPEYTGSLVLNFHRGSLTDKARIEKELTASSNTKG
jgi:hypothetical protein